MFITFEGVEGAGKTTQIRLLSERLRSLGQEVLVTREPGDGPLGPQLRNMALHPADGIVIDSTTELLIMMADRSQHVTNVIAPALNRGAVVICDRYADSSTAYQGWGRGVNISTIETLNDLATHGISPDCTVLLDLDPALGLARQSERNQMELQSLEFHRRVRSGFLALAGKNPVQWVIISAAASIAEVHEQVWSVVSRLQ